MSDLRLDRKDRTALNATVEAIRMDGLSMVFRCRPDPGHLRTYKPGQYTSLGLPVAGDGQETVFLKRAYSIADPMLSEDAKGLWHPDDYPGYEFYIRRVPPHPKGRPQLTPHLFQLNEGDRIFVGTKIVGFHTLDRVGPHRDLLFISTDTGEAPHNSIIRHTLSLGGKVRLASVLLGGPGWRSAYTAAHRALQESHQGYRFLEMEYGSQKGFLVFLAGLLKDPELSTQALGFPLRPATSHIFLCGDPAMIGAPKKRGGWEVEERAMSSIRLLGEHGFEVETKFQDGTITFEAYW